MMIKGLTVMEKASIRRVMHHKASSNAKYLSTNADAFVKRPGGKSWVPNDDERLQRVTTNALIHEFSLESMDAAKTVVPWFLKNMPASYFNQVPEKERKQHLKAIGALREFKNSGLTLRIPTQLENGGLDMTIITSDNKKGLLYDQVKSLVVPPNSELSKVKVFTSLDGEMSLNTFTFLPSKPNTQEASATRDDAAQIFEYISELREGKHPYSDSAAVKYDEALFGDAAMDDYLTRITPSYASTFTHPRRFLVQRELFEKVRYNDGAEVRIEPYSGSDNAAGKLKDMAWITVAASNVLPEVLFALTSGILKSRNFDIERSHLDKVSSHPENSTEEMPGSVTMLRMLVSPAPTKLFPEGSPEYAAFVEDIRRCKWLDKLTTDLGLVKYPKLGASKAEIIVTLCSMLHGPLAKLNPSTYSSIETIVSILDGSPHFVQIADSIAQLFVDKFDPRGAVSAEEFMKREAELHTKIARLHHEPARVLLLRLLDAVRLTLRTNFFNKDRYALSLRVNPSIMMAGSLEAKPLPFGVFFSHGRNFNAFHCRFRDIARGGLRIVTPNNSDQYSLESSRQFDEAYGLSYAQQLKNKDIPEGGAKAVVLVNSPGLDPSTKFFAARKAVKAFTDSLLDLIVKDSVSQLVDYYGKDELIYLGPDEQVIPSDIDWICHRALQRGYPIPAAFMSSKKGAGINHKEFGVTSEGVVVYLDEALKSVLQIDPKKDKFTIKITGGPDGDVAGNLLKILFREYGENARVVGIADGFGVAEDPSGLASAELLRLVRESLPITSFDRSKLSAEGVMMDVVTEEGLARRLSMCFRVKADAFVPAGGRPNTINIDNWKQFLDPATGKPSSSLIVEGANIFTTQEAREQFHKAGVTIVKDSSANKCGVITSSCEVAASMLLSKEEFMAVKKELVHDVVVNLKRLAKMEAELLFREYRNYPGALPHFSERISNAINMVTDAITDHLQDLQPANELFQELLPAVKLSLPAKLAAVAWDRVPARFPVQYQRNAIASTLAAHLVYKEGIHLVETQPLDRLAVRAIEYWRADQRVCGLAARMEGGGSLSDEERRHVLRLLRKGGPRASLEIF